MRGLAFGLRSSAGVRLCMVRALACPSAIRNAVLWPVGYSPVPS